MSTLLYVNYVNIENTFSHGKTWLTSLSHHLLGCERCSELARQLQKEVLTLSDNKATNKLKFTLSSVPPQSERNMLLVRYFIFLPSISSDSPSELPCMHIIVDDGCISNAGFTLIKTAQLKRSFRCRLLFWVERDRMVYWSLLMSATSSEFSKKKKKMVVMVCV